MLKTPKAQVSEAALATFLAFASRLSGTPAGCLHVPPTLILGEWHAGCVGRGGRAQGWQGNVLRCHSPPGMLGLGKPASLASGPQAQRQQPAPRS